MLHKSGNRFLAKMQAMSENAEPLAIQENRKRLPVGCIGKGKSHKAYEFSLKVSIVAVPHRSAGGQFVARVKAAPGNPP